MANMTVAEAGRFATMIQRFHAFTEATWLALLTAPPDAHPDRRRRLRDAHAARIAEYHERYPEDS